MFSALLRLIRIALVASICLAATWTHAAKVDVSITGVSRDLERNILAVTAIGRSRGAAGLTDRDIQRLHDRAPGEIARALQPFGFYRPEITAELIPGTKRWRARYVIDPGPPLLVDRVDLRLLGPGEHDSALQKLVRDFPLGAGDTLRHDAYETGKAAIAARAAVRGYLDARYDTSEIRIDPAAYRSEIVLQFVTGPRYLFGPVSIHQDIVDSLLLMGHIPFQPGDTLDLKQLRELQTSLAEATYFGAAHVELLRDSADGLRIPVSVELTPRKRRRYEIGLGYGTDTGTRGRLEAAFRRLNFRGHNATLRLEVSQIQRSLSAQYRIPPAYPKTALWTFSAGFGDFSPDWSESRAIIAGIARSRSVMGWNVTTNLNFEGEAFKIAQTEDSSFLTILGPEVSRVSADDFRTPGIGSRINLGLRGSYEKALSTASFVEATGELKVVRTLLGAPRLISRFQLGQVWSSTFHSLPPAVRFVTGGAQSVRGFKFQSLGPTNPQGQIVGGQSLIVGSVEFDYLFLKKLGRWGLAAFVDAGNALESFDTIVLEVGSGAGLRWASPVGMLRLDIAWPLSRPGDKYRVHFSMGPEL